MTWLIALVWALYASECVVRHRAGAIVFRGRAIGALRPIAEPDFDLAGGRLSISWAALLPWQFGFATGEKVDSHRGSRHARVSLLRAIRHTRPLQWASSALLLGLLVGMPVLILTERLIRDARRSGCRSLASIWLATVLLYFGAHREIHSRAPALEAWLMVVLSPLAAIRAPAQVLGTVTRGMSPFVVASIVCGDEELLKFFRRVYFDAPALRPDLERLLKSRRLAAALLAGSAPSEPGMRAFCPRCHTLYTVTVPRVRTAETSSWCPSPASYRRSEDRRLHGTPHSCAQSARYASQNDTSVNAANATASHSSRPGSP